MDKRKLTQNLGIVLILVGLLGFVNNPILGLFQVDILHNIVHILTGGAAVYLSRTQGEKGSILFGKVFAVVYGLLTLLGFITGSAIGMPGMVEVNAADHGLHIVLTAVFGYIGFYKS